MINFCCFTVYILLLSCFAASVIAVDGFVSRIGFLNSSTLDFDIDNFNVLNQTEYELLQRRVDECNAELGFNYTSAVNEGGWDLYRITGDVDPDDDMDAMMEKCVNSDWRFQFIMTSRIGPEPPGLDDLFETVLGPFDYNNQRPGRLGDYESSNSTSSDNAIVKRLQHQCMVYFSGSNQ
ncbi:hypothetical protein KGF57_003094 [Candida theae]|uniref:Uncharacterized protein n=1 Tax=Candida theae TaxID=1198502 RepID=A0AAD5BE49_9ASCO|nr:uncharacterized protein KGF57_003094 [Candida theae]KAI5957827.1 hypothetical protein KGF57_003094 [Candida theae]